MDLPQHKAYDEVHGIVAFFDHWIFLFYCLGVPLTIEFVIEISIRCSTVAWFLPIFQHSGYI